MTEIIVNNGELQKFSTQIEENAIEFGIITKNMQDIVEALKKKGWSGYDADRFIKNATEYLSDLKIVQDALLDSSSTVKDKNKGYKERVERYKETMKDRRETNE